MVFRENTWIIQHKYPVESGIIDGALTQTYLRPCGIAGNLITSICQNKDGVLWIGTNRGISTLTFGTMTLGPTAIKPNKSQERYTISKNSPYSILNIGSNSRKIPAGAGIYLLNGKKGSSSTKQLPLRTVNCYIVKPDRDSKTP